MTEPVFCQPHSVDVTTCKSCNKKEQAMTADVRAAIWRIKTSRFNDRSDVMVLLAHIDGEAARQAKALSAARDENSRLLHELENDAARIAAAVAEERRKVVALLKTTEDFDDVSDGIDLVMALAEAIERGDHE